MLKYLNIKKQKKSGFSLLEVLVAITVLIVGLVGVVGLIVHNVSISRASPEKIIAVNLAQEGIEVVRNIRDSNWLDPADPNWDDDINAGECILSVNDPDDLIQGWELDTVGGGNTWKRDVYYDTAYHYYGQIKFKNPPQRPNRWERTNFTRLIEIDKLGVGWIKVISQVEWTDRAGPHTVTLEAHLWDWE